jgi:hypothetical protein
VWDFRPRLLDCYQYGFHSPPFFEEHSYWV